MTQHYFNTEGVQIKMKIKLFQRLNNIIAPNYPKQPKEVHLGEHLPTKRQKH